MQPPENLLAPEIMAIGHILDGEQAGMGWDRDMILTLSMMKIQEEAGEVADAWSDYLGSNPLKREISSSDTVDKFEHLIDELSDVALTAMVAIARLGRDPVVAVHIRAEMKRKALQENRNRDPD